MNTPYRTSAGPAPMDPRAEADAALARAKAELIDEIRRGLKLANDQSRNEIAESYALRLSALERLYRTVCGDGV